MTTQTQTMSAPTGVRGIVHRYPLISFFSLAFGLSWLAWIPYILSDSGLGLIPLTMPRFLGTDQFAGVLPGAYLGPVTAAFIVTALADGRGALRKWAARLVRWRVGWRWYLVVLTGVPLSILAASFALPGAAAQARVPALTVLAMYLPLLIVQFFTTALAEEPGWRDFALPRLQRRYGPTAGTVVLGLLWGCWHLPLFLTSWGGWPNQTWVQPVEFVLTCVPLSLVMTWVFNRTRESLPIVMVLHASINTFYSLVWSQVFPHLDPARDGGHTTLLGAGVVALVLIVATRGRLGLTVDQHGGGQPGQDVGRQLPGQGVEVAPAYPSSPHRN